MINKNFANDWIQSADLWCRKQPLYQLSHNYCPKGSYKRTFVVHTEGEDKEDRHKKLL